VRAIGAVIPPSPCTARVTWCIRLAWTLRYGKIPQGFVLCHRCDERRCINPDHHFVGTHQDNMADMAQKRRGRPAA
jgi:hypothetical protein